MASPMAMVFSPAPKAGHVRAADGALVAIPEGWACVPPGDAGLTRRVKALGPSWTVIEVVGRKKFSKGVWAERQLIEGARIQLEAERSTPAYARKREAAVKRREVAQQDYVEDFGAAVKQFLRFTPHFAEQQETLAARVTAHATPVGSGTVARTERIPLEQRAESAVIAWMRHATTAYDSMKVARVKGARRQVRRQLAEVSRAVLDLHRGRVAHPPSGCPLCGALV